MRADPAILLDVSRLISRLGKGPATGIDRVEAEWLAHLAQGTGAFLLLARIGRRQVLLPASAAPAILRWSSGDLSDLPDPGLFDRLRGRRDAVAQAGLALRRVAIMTDNAGARGIARRVLAMHGPFAAYLNVGHSNLSRPLWQGLAGLCRVLLLHDTIPLDHPEFTRAGQAEKFRARFSAAMSEADLVVTISEASRNAILHWRDRLRLPRHAPVVIAPIGTRLVTAQPAAVPEGLDLGRPYFVTLGTIEPRKNHALLLDAWEELARRLPPAKMPQLFIIGRRGWENREVFERLDRLPAQGPVRELAGLDDGAVASLIEGSHGLLMPSRAEGFGLPLTEAAARGVVVICSPLASARELLGQYAHYLSPDDARAWAGAVSLLAGDLPLRLTPLAVPQWHRHFDLVTREMREMLQVRVVGAISG